MHKRSALLATVAVSVIALTGCSAGIGSSASEDGGEDDKTPVELTLWSFFGDREKDVVDARLDAFTEQYPWITVDHVGGQSDDTLLQAVRGGTGPDVALSGSTESVSSYCSTGVFQNLDEQIAADEVDVDTILESTEAYTSFEGERCALPMLADVYGLYYNTELLAAAGFTEPPTTWDELSEMAKALTVRDADGTIQVAGFVPFLDFGQNNVASWTTGWGLEWYDDEGAPLMATDPQWAAMFEWQKELVDWYGYDNLQRYVASAGNEFTTENPFYTGKLAMTIDGEWRVAFAENEVPEFQYGTAPIPADDESYYGGSVISGTTVGIPRGSGYPEAAWLLTKYLGTDTENLVDLTLNLRNVPTTTGSLDDDSIRTIPQFNVMLDLAADENTRSIPGTPAASAPRELMGQFAQAWQAGSVDDLQSGLDDTADQIASQIEQAAGGNAP